MRSVKIFVLLFILFSISLFGEAKPFPQYVDYPYGYQTTKITATNVQNAYNKWKSKYLKRCNGMLRVCGDDTSVTISEGMGYGMLLTAYFGEKGKFDSLFAFYKSKRTSLAYNLMGWKVTCSSISDPGSATDGDIDVAFALIVAYCQWGENYLEEAKNIISILKNYYFVNCNNVYVMKPGGHWGGCGLTDISYYTPAYFRIFGEVMNDSFWEKIAEDSYIILENSADSNTGLVPDWQSYDGIPGGNPPSGRDDYYHYDACRTPWRMALDYIWNGNENAKNWCCKVSKFADSIGASNIKDGYLLDGTLHPQAQYNNSSFVGGFGVGGMCYSQSMVDAFALRLLYLDGCGYDDQYYNLSLRSLYMLVLTGNFWKPTPMGIEESLPKYFYLGKNFPNPFMTTTTIEYFVPESRFVQLQVFDVVGREVKTLINEEKPAGRYSFIFNGSDLSTGIYFYRIKAGDFTSELLQMILIK
ncbi:MAG: glycosyl hydrolase family 8 [candidate division WOR-3 bacterium]